MPLPLITNAERYGEAPAILAAGGSFTYDQLLRASAATASTLLAGSEDPGKDLGEARIAFLVPPGFDYVATQWGIWRAGGVAVPLAVMHTSREMEYVLDDARVAMVIAHSSYTDQLRPLIEKRSVPLSVSTSIAMEGPGIITALPDISSSRRAMILYTSGTTSRPKGAVISHANIQAQVEALVTAWEWTADDHILNVLPLHHVHGIINVLTCALWVGATCEFLPRFDATHVWERFASRELTLFMAVPTVYSKLIAAWEATPQEERPTLTKGCEVMRLMVSGSAALPVSTLEEWRSITGHVLLERYGMTEIGMALSNSLRGERRPGHVGRPLPDVEVRLVDEAGIPLEEPNTPGEIQVRGPGVFLEYWGMPEATEASFSGDWFRTGDIAVNADGAYRILGRKSVDIINTGGNKVSALEIEEILLEHAEIHECAVIGIPDDVWGERVTACVALPEDSDLTLDGLRLWAKDRLAPYKLPGHLRVFDQLPRNSMGKVEKRALKDSFDSQGELDT